MMIIISKSVRPTYLVLMAKFWTMQIENTQYTRPGILGLSLFINIKDPQNLHSPTSSTPHANHGNGLSPTRSPVDVEDCQGKSFSQRSLLSTAPTSHCAANPRNQQRALSKAMTASTYSGLSKGTTPTIFYSFSYLQTPRKGPGRQHRRHLRRCQSRR
jgi:hypothetical protein